MKEAGWEWAGQVPQSTGLKQVSKPGYGVRGKLAFPCASVTVKDLV